MSIKIMFSELFKIYVLFVLINYQKYTVVIATVYFISVAVIGKPALNFLPRRLLAIQGVLKKFLSHNFILL